MRLPTGALVLVRPTGVALSNVAFNRLCRVAAGALVRAPEPTALSAPVPPPAGRRDRMFPSLRELVCFAAADLLARGGRGPRRRRYRVVGREQWLDAVFQRLSEDGDVVAGMLHDVTSQVKAELDLLSAQQALARQEQARVVGELAAGVVHDVSNTLAAIRLRLSTLRRDPACMSSQGPNIDALGRILREGSDMLQKLQHLGNVDDGRPLEPVDLREIIESAVEIAQSGLRYRALQDGIDIRIDSAVPALPSVMAWREDLQRAVVNLLINARDAMPLGGHIRVSGADRGDHVLITIEDEGSGIPEDVLPRIFEPYFTTKGSGGTGMGLATVQRAMARVGGAVFAANRAGGGAVFTLRFPTRAVAAAPADLPSSPD